jgi:hypothetical protein
MQLLRQLGLEPGHASALKACALYLDQGLGRDGGINFWQPRRRTGEACVTGMVLAQLSWFGIEDRRIERLVEYLLREQMPDGGWNCLRPRGAVHSSFHTTTSVLEGLQEYAAGKGRRAEDALAAAARGRERQAAHRHHRAHTTGRIVATERSRFHFLPQWRHGLLRGSSLSIARSPDRRLEEAVAIVRSARTPWPLAWRVHTRGRALRPPAGAPSRMNTLRAARPRLVGGPRESAAGTARR